MKTVLVTGANGQLGRCIQDIAISQLECNYIFQSSSELDITCESQIENFFGARKIDYCINCAAYTAVDKAEIEKDKAFLVNAKGVELLAKACKRYGATLIHISTDFVFDGSKQTPYTEADEVNPINIYGKSKLLGERHVIKTLQKYFIIRTSWVYSEYGHNFVRTMLNLGKERNKIDVVQDQKGSPTYARDLAKFLITLISENRKDYGTYNYSNSGITNWHEFAIAIFEIEGKNINVNPIFAKDYKTLAIRPKYSALDNTLSRFTFKTNVPFWRDSLKKCLTQIDKK